LGLREDLIFCIVSWSECWSSCIECDIQKTWMPKVVVVGGIYSPQPHSSRWPRLLAMGAPDSPVRHRTCIVRCPVCRHVSQPLGFGAGRPLEALSSCGIGQSGAPLTSCSDFCRGTVPHCSSVRVDRCAQIAVAPLAHRTVR
jgi:hypothetical protein